MVAFKKKNNYRMEIIRFSITYIVVGTHYHFLKFYNIFYVLINF